jgi:hypothetical protein
VEVRIAGVAAVKYRPAVAAVPAVAAAPGVEAVPAVAAQPQVLAVAAVMEELEQFWSTPSAEERAATDVIGVKMSEADQKRFFPPHYDPTHLNHLLTPHPLQP